MNNCQIIQDLLPAYISGIASMQTRHLVEEHIASCEQCQKQLYDMENRMVTQLHENENRSVHVLKRVHQGIRRRQALAAIVAGIIAVLLAGSVFWLIHRYNLPIAYDSTTVRVEQSFSQVRVDSQGETQAMSVLDIVSAKPVNNLFTTSRIVVVDGTQTEVVYLYLSETYVSKWWPQHGAEQVLHLAYSGAHASLGSEAISNPSLPLEVYYLIAPLHKYVSLSDVEFYELRSDGNLLWSGKLADTVVFPVSDRSRTTANAVVFDIDPFGVDVTLPDDWFYNDQVLQTPSNRIDLGGVWSIVNIFDAAGERVAGMGYCIYQEYEGAEDLPQAIYGQIALGNNYRFDVHDSYTVVREFDHGKTAICDVLYSFPQDGGLTRYTKTNRGIVSYNKDLLVYIAIELDSDIVSEEQTRAIAESVYIR